MSPPPVTDWNPAAYGAFGDQRLRPALDLLARVGELPSGDIIDLGCGAGVMGAPLRARFPDARLIGVDLSPAMLEKAAATDAYDALQAADFGTWTADDSPPALIYSNAALHWQGDHAQLMPRLAECLMPGGTLAVQMPHQNTRQSHRLWHDLAEELAPGRVDRATIPGILDAGDYHRILSPLGRVDIWETEYLQRLDASEQAHPVRAFTSSTFARPVLEAFTGAEQARLAERYDTAVGRCYPRADDGSVLFPFRRLFFTLDIA